MLLFQSYTVLALVWSLSLLHSATAQEDIRIEQICKSKKKGPATYQCPTGVTVPRSFYLSEDTRVVKQKKKTKPCILNDSYKIVNNHLEIEKECKALFEIVYKRRDSEKKTVIACEHTSAALSCLADQTISVVSAVYGRTDRTTCPNSAMSNTNCRTGAAATSLVEKLCTGQNACSVSASNGIFGDPCVGTFKYLQVVYLCTYK